MVGSRDSKDSKVLRIHGFIQRGKEGVSRGRRLERKDSGVDGRHR